ncbi:hypothetical protein DAEQUDRAFT_90156 [Daedalea quercina L-15889]|uniref:Uncharacterized protein n=1 Tax=Daedalea quercina L-15889 TaxID=1314783 RepID=A0A165S7V0_9APHY|nr:hypothetical protein DAEQUDRAFT_90156 [Daedalea quercina L-15889]
MLPWKCPGRNTQPCSCTACVCEIGRDTAYRPRGARSDSGLEPVRRRYVVRRVGATNVQAGVVRCFKRVGSVRRPPASLPLSCQRAVGPGKCAIQCQCQCQCQCQRQWRRTCRPPSIPRWRRLADRSVKIKAERSTTAAPSPALWPASHERANAMSVPSAGRGAGRFCSRLMSPDICVVLVVSDALLPVYSWWTARTTS